MLRRSLVSASGRLDPLVPVLVRSSAVRKGLLALPQSRLRREALIATFRWEYGRFNETGALPVPVLDPAMEFEQASALIDTAGTFSGIDGFEAMVSELREAFGEIRFEPKSVIWLSRNQFLVMIRFQAMGGGSGVGIEREIAHWLTMRDGRVVRFSVFWEPSDALEAAGLSE